MAVCRSITPVPANCCLPPVPPGRWNRRSPNKASAECASSTKQTRHLPRAQGSRVCLEPYKTNKKCRPVKGAAKLCRLCGARAIPHNSKCRYGERGAADAKPKGEKHFALKPCSTEEAILQMDLLGHSFFLYHSTENDKIQVVYRRADGGYGVLIPEA